MWLLVMFDLPVQTRQNRKDYRDFHDYLEGDGFTRIQFSVYARPCATEENTQTHLDRVISKLPPDGEVRVLKFTDKQWMRMLLFHARRNRSPEAAPEQLVFFDEQNEPLLDEQGDVDVENRIWVNFAERAGSGIEKLRKISENRKKRFKRGEKEEPPSFDFFD